MLQSSRISSQFWPSNWLQHLQISGRRAITANKQHSSKNEKSFRAPKKDKNLLTRRNFISAAAGMGAMGVIAKGAKKTKEDESKMPVWTGRICGSW